MTHVSKNSLKSEYQQELFQQFAALAASGNKKQTEDFLSVLLTESEQIMFVKRVAAVLLFTQEHSPYRISQTLKMSESTVNRIRLKYELGIYQPIIKLSKKKEFNSEKFWDIVETCLRLGMPSMGKDRWKSLR